MSSTSTLLSPEKLAVLDEPLVLPFTPAEALLRLSQVLGATRRYAKLPAVEDGVLSARQALLLAVESDEPVKVCTAMEHAHIALVEAYGAAQENPELLAQMKFPAPEIAGDDLQIRPIDVASVNATFSLRGKQVLTSLSFERSANATSYWLHEVRFFQATGERVENPILESAAPFFARARFPVGTVRLRVKSRNVSTSAISEEFEITVPSLR